jgi:hypothetical protein
VTWFCVSASADWWVQVLWNAPCTQHVLKAYCLRKERQCSTIRRHSTLKYHFCFAIFIILCLCMLNLSLCIIALGSLQFDGTFGLQNVFLSPLILINILWRPTPIVSHSAEPAFRITPNFRVRAVYAERNQETVETNLPVETRNWNQRRNQVGNPTLNVPNTYKRRDFTQC